MQNSAMPKIKHVQLHILFLVNFALIRIGMNSLDLARRITEYIAREMEVPRSKQDAIGDAEIPTP